MTKRLKNIFNAVRGLALMVPLAACGGVTLMSEADEAKIGAQQHPNIIREYGGVYKNAKLTAYVEAVMARIGQFSCLLYTSPSPRDMRRSRMPSSA